MDIVTLTQTLWPKGNGPECPQVYALLDGARDDAIAPAIWMSNLPHACLFAGALSRPLQLAAPYLVQLAPDSRFFSTLVNKGWGQAWGVFVVAQPDVTLKELRKHFRTLLRVQDEQGRILAFRFYDPRVLRLFMPTCEPSETLQVLGPVKAMACESAQGDALLEFKSARASLTKPLHRSHPNIGGREMTALATLNDSDPSEVHGPSGRATAPRIGAISSKPHMPIQIHREQMAAFDAAREAGFRRALRAQTLLICNETAIYFSAEELDCFLQNAMLDAIRCGLRLEADTAKFTAIVQRNFWNYPEDPLSPMAFDVVLGYATSPEARMNRFAEWAEEQSLWK